VEDKNPVVKYRKDIDGLRAIAVIAVILFHFGYLPNGYLGVDVFFVISGYLITKIIYDESKVNQFSLTQFYIRRIRRIIPLILFICTLAGVIGICLMLPDDLENLCESIVATNFFSNNILQYITTHNYWDVVNEYKPLIHTWSLGIEEQYYVIYPLIFLLLGSKRINWIVPVLIISTIISLFIFFLTNDAATKFYLLPSRFFELSIGGLGSILSYKKTIHSKLKSAFIIVLILFLFVDINIPGDLKLFITIILSAGILVVTDNSGLISLFILENKVVVWIGKISFSLYMWHQLILAFTRYAFLENYNIIQALLIIIAIILLSIASYNLIEQPFRNSKKIKISTLLWCSGLLFLISTCGASYIYMKAGVIKDFPELNIVKSNAKRNMHAAYNDRIYKLDKDFTNDNKIKVLIIGNSFGRDWANVLLESKYGKLIEISYAFEIETAKNVSERLRKADNIYFADLRKEKFNKIVKDFTIDTTKVWMVGTKNFGVNNGIYYNKEDCNQRVAIGKEFLQMNEQDKRDWGNKLIDMIGMVIDKNGKVPVFTSDCKFISQDCRHLTSSGAKYYSRLIEANSQINIKK
jgi:peptidoglycan/LPS O-acetylase OafA/YrhL